MDSKLDVFRYAYSIFLPLPGTKKREILNSLVTVYSEPRLLGHDHLALHPTLDQSPKIVLAADWTQDTSLLYSHFPLKSMYSASTVVLGDLIKHASYPAYLSSVVSS